MVGYFLINLSNNDNTISTPRKQKTTKVLTLVVFSHGTLRSLILVCCVGIEHTTNGLKLDKTDDSFGMIFCII